MPKLRKRVSRYEQLQALLYGQLWTHGKKPEDLLGCFRETAAKRLRDIDRMPVGDLLALGRGLDIPIADLRAAIRYQ